VAEVALRTRMEVSDQLMLLRAIAHHLGTKGLTDYDIPGDRLRDNLDGLAATGVPERGYLRLLEVQQAAEAAGGEVGG
jgi:hypothetical protein